MGYLWRLDWLGGDGLCFLSEIVVNADTVLTC